MTYFDSTHLACVLFVVRHFAQRLFTGYNNNFPMAIASTCKAAQEPVAIPRAD
jgi:hypothetical protein